LMLHEQPKRATESPVASFRADVLPYLMRQATPCFHLPQITAVYGSKAGPLQMIPT